MAEPVAAPAATSVRRPRRLRVGEVVRFDGRLWRVDLVNDCRARLTPLDARKVQYETWDGCEVDFDARGRSINICADAEVERLDASTLKETIMASKKKTTKPPKTQKAPRTPPGDLCTFAIRIPKTESAAIHKAAGPGKASAFARTVLAAAAAGDLDAIKKAIER